MNAVNNAQIEYIVIIDEDDDESIKSLEETKIMFRVVYGVNLKILITKRVGYPKLHHYHNLAAVHFTGDCLLMRTDHHFCTTHAWDTKVRENIKPYKNEPIIIHQKGNNENVWWATAWGVNRKWYEVSTNNGEIALAADVGIDVWLIRMAEQTDMKVIPAGYDMISMQRGKEHATKIGGLEYQLPEDELVKDTRIGKTQKTSDPEVREQLIENLKRWKTEN